MPRFSMNLRNYYVPDDGWRFDKVPLVVQGLKRIRFFNRFSEQHIHQIVIRSEFRTLKAAEIAIVKEEREKWESQWLEQQVRDVMT